MHARFRSGALFCFHARPAASAEHSRLHSGSGQHVRSRLCSCCTAVLRGVSGACSTVALREQREQAAP